MRDINDCVWPVKLGDISRLRNALLKYLEIFVKWIILPPDDEEDLRDFFSNGKSKNNYNGKKKGQEDRIKFLVLLPIRALIRGKALGAKTEYRAVLVDGWVIADNPEWGNALFICPADHWQQILPLCKRLAIKAGAIRICHQQGWQERALEALDL